MGGLDACFGRWDTRDHPLADVHPTEFQKALFPGQGELHGIEISSNRYQTTTTRVSWTSRTSKSTPRTSCASRRRPVCVSWVLLFSSNTQPGTTPRSPLSAPWLWTLFSTSASVGTLCVALAEVMLTPQVKDLKYKHDHRMEYLSLPDRELIHALSQLTSSVARRPLGAGGRQEGEAGFVPRRAPPPFRVEGREFPVFLRS